jgi:chromate transporter
MAEIVAAGPGEGDPREVFVAFLRMGLTCFGGPVAHIGYFRDEFVGRRHWLDEAAFGDLVAICQFLPGPASSQLGFAIGLRRCDGLAGGLAAWLGFTLPSAVLLVAMAAAAPAVAASALGAGIVHGLKLVAVAVVAQAVLGMARALAPDRPRAAIALAAVAIVAFAANAAAQIVAIAAGALLGLWLCRQRPVHADHEVPIAKGHRTAVVSLALFAVLLALTFVPLPHDEALALFAAFYRTGALVFGGGHVVLPLLQSAVVPHWVSSADFLAGYGVAQAVPGPLFTFAAWLGFLARPFGGLAAAALAVVAIFLPGLLLVFGVLPFWNRLRNRSGAQAAMRGANAAVIGILAAALYDPVWTGAVTDARDFALALAGFLALIVWRSPPWLVVVALAAAGAVRAALGA